jgi:hypothetical protein
MAEARKLIKLGLWKRNDPAARAVLAHLDDLAKSSPLIAT